MVRPRPAGRRPLPAQRLRGARPRDVRPRPPEERTRPAPGRARPQGRLGPARNHRGVRLRHPPRRVPGVGRGGGDRGRLLRPELPVRGARDAPPRGGPHRRPLRLGALRRRARRGRAGGLRDRLLLHPRRAGALPRLRDREPADPVGAAPGAAGSGVRPRGADCRDRAGHVRLPRRLHRPPQAGEGGGRGVHADARPEPAADRHRPGGPQAARRGRASWSPATPGSSSSWTTCPGSSTSPASRAATSASRPAAGRAWACRCTRRPRSGCRSSSTTTRR